MTVENPVVSGEDEQDQEENTLDGDYIPFPHAPGHRINRPLLEIDYSSVNIPPVIYYPFSSKYYKIHKYPYQETVHDIKLSSIKKLNRPYFSPHSGSWEIDYFHSGDNPDEEDNMHKIYRFYLFCININTKYLVVYPCEVNQHPTSYFTLHCIDDLRKKYEVKSVRGDGDRAFVHLPNEIKTYFSSSKYTNKNRVIDRVMRTIRDGVGLDKELLLIPEIIQQIVLYYNNTPHTAYENLFTPTEVQSSKFLEGWFVRRQQRRLIDALRLQHDKFLNTYTPGCILLIYLPRGKTSDMFQKRRRNFDTLAEFIRYEYGNVVCRVLKEANEITVPIQYTKYIASSLFALSPEIIRMFNMKLDE